MRFQNDDEHLARRKARAALGTWGNLVGTIGAVFFVGWILFLTYNAFAPDALPYMGLWTGFGIVFLFNYVTGRIARAIAGTD